MHNSTSRSHSASTDDDDALEHLIIDISWANTKHYYDIIIIILLFFLFQKGSAANWDSNKN